MDGQPFRSPSNDNRVQANRRAFPRWPAVFDVEYGQGKKLIPGKGRDIGECGCSFLGTVPVEPLTEIDVRYKLPTFGEWVQVRALVKHVIPTPEGLVLGVEFMTLRIADRLRIIEFFATNPA